MVRTEAMVTLALDWSYESSERTGGKSSWTWVPQVCLLLANLGVGPKGDLLDLYVLGLDIQVSQQRRDLGHPAPGIRRRIIRNGFPYQNLCRLWGGVRAEAGQARVR